MADLKSLDLMQVTRLMIEAREVHDMGCYEKYFKELALRSDGYGSLINNEDPIEFIMQAEDAGDVPEDVIQQARDFREMQIRWLRDLRLDGVADTWEAIGLLSGGDR